MKSRLYRRLLLLAQVILTISISSAIVFFTFSDLLSHSESYAADSIADYNKLVDRYTSVFRALTIDVKNQIEADVSFEAMDAYLREHNADFAEAVGQNVFDGFAMTYKGGYAHSWSYGDYSDYDPSSRPWYIQAREAGGKITVVAPYVTFLDEAYLEQDQYIELTVAQRYNDEISFDLDLKINDIKSILRDRETLFDGTTSLLVDKNGYILSTNNHDYYCRNIKKSDDVVSSGLVKSLAKFDGSSEKHSLSVIGGKLCALFSGKTDGGNTVYIFTPVGEIFVKRFLQLLIITLLLILLELFIYIRNSRKLSNATRLESLSSKIAGEAFDRRIDINPENMSCRDSVTGKASKYSDVYRNLYRKVVGGSSKSDFEKFLSPEALKRNFRDNVTLRQRFPVEWSENGASTVQICEYLVMNSVHGKRRNISLLVSNISDKEKHRFNVFQSIALHYSCAFLGNLDTRMYETIKFESTEFGNDRFSGIISGDKIAGLATHFKAQYRDKFTSMLSVTFIEGKLSSADEYTVTVQSENDHWYLLRIIRCADYATSREFVLCTENIDERMKRQKELEDALNVAESATKAKSSFLAQMSHDIRTPMNAIIGISSLARDHVGNPDAINADLDRIDLSSHILLNLINDILDMSAIESGKLKISNSPFDFKQLISSVTSIYYGKCSDKGIKFTSKLITPIDETLVGDKLRVNQILMNLLSNAVKFTTEGEVSLTVESHEISDKRLYIRITVSDTGCGMSKQMMRKIFEPFEQGTPDTARLHGGSGLGLSIVSNLVTMMGGYIDVSSEMDAGSTFVVELPFDRISTGTMPVIAKTESINVLVVDDEDDTRRYMAKILTRIGVRFKVLGSGKAALEEIKAAKENGDRFNVCIVDWKMPDMNGFELTKSIHEYMGDEETSIIVASSYQYTEIENDAKAAGAQMFLQKPLFQSSLVDLFMTLSGGRLIKNEQPSENYDFGGKRVLVVEDNEMNRVVVEGLLERVNIVCDFAENGEEGFNKFTSSEPKTYAAVLMDLQMPVMDGFECTRAIRSSQHSEAGTIPIIALTANAFADDVAKCFSVGMNDHVSKPVDMKVLVAALKKVIE